MGSDRVLRVPRAAGVEATLTPEPPREREPIQANEHDQQTARWRAGDPRELTSPPHERATRARESSFSTSVTSSCVRARWMLARATSAMSYPSRTVGSSSRHAARRMRRARLRKTAPPTRRPATNATVPEPGATNTTTRSPWNARPDARMRPTSALVVAARDLRSRLRAQTATPTDGNGPWLVGGRRSRARHASASEGGTHGAWPVDDCSAGTSASTSRVLRKDRSSGESPLAQAAKYSRRSSERRVNAERAERRESASKGPGRRAVGKTAVL